MPLEKTVHDAVAKIATANKDVENKTVAVARESFHAAHMAADKSGASMKKATEEVLAGVDAGLKAANYKTGVIVGKCAKAISEDTHKSVEAALEASRKAADTAKEALSAATKAARDKTNASAQEAEKAAKEAMSKAYSALAKANSQAQAHLQDIAAGLRDYAKSKSQETNAALLEAAKEAESDLQALREKSAAHGKHLIHHSEEKLAHWLGEMKNKVEALYHKA